MSTLALGHLFQRPQDDRGAADLRTWVACQLLAIVVLAGLLFPEFRTSAFGDMLLGLILLALVGFAVLAGLWAFPGATGRRSVISLIERMSAFPFLLLVFLALIADA